MRVSPSETAPNISERCEIDLSPGTRIRPFRLAPARAESGMGVAAWLMIVLVCLDRISFGRPS